MNTSQTLIHHAEFSVMVSYNDPDKVTEIDLYYQNLLSELSLSNRLDAEEKLGQVAFLTKQWEGELDPFTEVLSIKKIWISNHAAI